MRLVPLFNLRPILSHFFSNAFSLYLSRVVKSWLHFLMKLTMVKLFELLLHLAVNLLLLLFFSDGLLHHWLFVLLIFLQMLLQLIAINGLSTLFNLVQFLETLFLHGLYKIFDKLFFFFLIYSLLSAILFQHVLDIFPFLLLLLAIFLPLLTPKSLLLQLFQVKSFLLLLPHIRLLFQLLLILFLHFDIRSFIISFVLAINAFHSCQKLFQFLISLWWRIPITFLSKFHQILKLFACLSINRRYTHNTFLHVSQLVAYGRLQNFNICLFVYFLTAEFYLRCKYIVLKPNDLLQQILCTIILRITHQMTKIRIRIIRKS